MPASEAYTPTVVSGLFGRLLKWISEWQILSLALSLITWIALLKGNTGSASLDGSTPEPSRFSLLKLDTSRRQRLLNHVWRLPDDPQQRAHRPARVTTLLLPIAQNVKRHGNGPLIGAQSGL